MKMPVSPCIIGLGLEYFLMLQFILCWLYLFRLTCLKIFLVSQRLCRIFYPKVNLMVCDEITACSNIM
jgi:hypothetical protein